jgi:hypothetical protein
MTRKSLYVLAVAVWIGGMAAVALADESGRYEYGSPDSSVSSQPEQGMERPQPGVSREPMETGAVPEQPRNSFGLKSNAVGDEPKVESGGVEFRRGIDTGP